MFNFILCFLFKINNWLKVIAETKKEHIYIFFKNHSYFVNEYQGDKQHFLINSRVDLIKADYSSCKRLVGLMKTYCNSTSLTSWPGIETRLIRPQVHDFNTLVPLMLVNLQPWLYLTQYAFLTSPTVRFALIHHVGKT